MKFETPIPLGNIAQISEVVISIFGADDYGISAVSLFGHAYALEKYFLELGMPIELCEGAVATIIQGPEPTTDQAAIGHKAILIRTDCDWQLIHLGHAIRYPGSGNESEIKFTRQQKAWIDQAYPVAA